MPTVRNADAAILLLGVASVLGAALFVHNDSKQQLRKSVLGSWEEVRGTKEVLQFNGDGTVIMDRVPEYHRCLYDFPDLRSIRLDCAPEGALPNPRKWKFSMSSDMLTIGDGREVSTYKRE